MKLIHELKGLVTYAREDGLIVKSLSKFSAWNLKNRIEKQGYAVDIERNQDEYIIRIWGANLMDNYLLRNNKYAI